MIHSVATSTAATCITLLATLGFTSTAQAEGFRCGNKLALPGATRMEVRAKCGEPSDVVHSSLIRRTALVGRGADRRGTVYSQDEYSQDEIVAIPVEVWTYNLGPHRFMRRLRFANGLLEAVETMGYGYDEAAAQ